MFMGQTMAFSVGRYRELVRKTPGYTLDEAEVNVREEMSGKNLTLAEFIELYENGSLQIPQQHGGYGQLKDDRNYEVNTEEPSARRIDSARAVGGVKWYSDDEISGLVGKMPGWLFFKDARVVVNKAGGTCEDCQDWMANQMEEGNFGWDEEVRELATKRGYVTNPVKKVVYKVHTREKYDYKEFLGVVERALEKEAQAAQLETIPDPNLTPRSRDEKRKQTKKVPGSQKKTKSERSGTQHIDYEESDDEDDDEDKEVQVVSIRKPLVVYSKCTNYQPGDTHDSLELGSGCEVIANVVAQLKKEEPFRLLFGK
jgi:hypothetical protein